MVSLTTSDLAAVNAAYWATMKNTIKLQKDYFSFKDREYLREPMESKFRRLCYMKGTQGGGSTVEILKSYHGMIFGRLPTGVLYLFPTSDDVYDYSRAIISPLVTSNPRVLGKWIKGVKGADSATLKRVNGANLYMRGAGLTKKVEGEGVSSRVTGIPVDRIVFDEIEQMDKEIIRKAIERMGNSSVKEEVYIGNPGIPGRGIDEIFTGSDDFRGSDQRHWFRKCQHCGKEPPIGADWFWYIDPSNGWTCAEESFPGCVKVRIDGTGYIGCEKCGEEVFVRDGEWIPKNKDNSDYMHGYRWSQLTSPNNDPYEILEAFNNPPHGNLTDVYRLKLGAAYVATEDRLTIGQVLVRCGPFIMGDQDPGPCSFGLDVGKIKHLVIGKRTGTKSYEIVKVARLSSWKDVGEMVRRFKCIRGVIDEAPYFDEAVRFQDSIRIQTYLCHYSDPYIPTHYDDKKRTVKTHRTGIFDGTHNLVAENGLLTIPRNSSEIQEFAKQVCDPAKSLEINKKTNEAVYRYKGRQDHYRNGLNYFLLAAHNTPCAYSHRNKQEDTVDDEYAII